MRDYPRKNGKYKLPTPVYHQTIWLIRDYDRICEELGDIILASPDPPDGQPSGHHLTDEVVSKVSRREHLADKKRAIDDALERIPEEYRRGVWDNIQLRRAFPNDAGRATYGRWKSLFILDIALSMGFVEKR